MRCALFLPMVLLSMPGASPVSAQVSVVTYHNDVFRTGQNLKETVLTPANVKSATFGKLFTYPVDGYIFAQPLYLPNVAIAGKGTHNVVFIATENDSVYAFDADSNAGGNATPLWHASFINPAAGVTTVPNSDVGSTGIVPQIGITGTPVIDPAGGTLYVVANTKEVISGNTRYVQRVHSLDVTSGQEKFGGPFLIAGYFPGSCAPNDGKGHVIFSPMRQNQRAGLLLYRGYLYVTWASHGDNNPYAGWIMVFNAQSPKAPIAIFNTSPDTGIPGECRAGVWQGGAAPAADSSGSVFLSTGNGYFNASADGRDYGDSMLRLTATQSGIAVADYFTPYNQGSLDGIDSDLGSGGLLLLPDQPGPNPHLLVGVGKEGTVYLVNRDNMGKYQAGSDGQIVQSLPGAVGGVWGMGAYFNGNVYLGGQFDHLKSFRLANGRLGVNPTSQSGTTFGFPGPTPSISANGATNGIVWALQNDGYNSSGPAYLHAYSTTDLGTELYNSNQNASRDQLGPAVKFSVPTVANGKVYAGTGNSLAVFGLL